MKLICQVYRSPRRPESYLYVEKARGLEDVPEALLRQFGKPEKVMVLLLTPTKKLARVAVADVMATVREQGYFLQMPPTEAQLQRRDGSSGQ